MIINITKQILKQGSIFFLLLFLTFHLFAGSVLATYYGEGSYGSAAYDQDPPPESSSQTSSTLDCRDQAPGLKTPNIYAAISEGKKSVKLYFTQADQPFDKYFVRFGINSGDYPYGGEFEANADTRTITINHLSENTKYYFQMKAGSGCAAGEWGNELAGSSKQTSGNWISNNFTDNNNDFKITDIESKSYSQEDEIENIDVKVRVKVKVINEEGESSSGVKVILHSDPKEAITDDDGIATFENVEKGEHKIIVEHGKQSGEQAINLSGDTDEYVITVQMKSTSSGYSLIQLVGTAILSLLVFAIAVLAWNKRR